MKSPKTYNLALASSRTSLPFLPKSTSNPNIFRQPSLEDRPVLNINTLKAHGCVGLKEMKSFYERVGRSSKQRRRQTHISGTALSRTSINPSTSKGNNLLSSEELIEKINNQIESHTKTTNQTQPRSILFTNTSNGSNGYSLLKKHLRHMEYVKHWQSLRSQQQQKGAISMIDRVEQSRKKQMERQRSHLAFMKENINQRQWQGVLRSKEELSRIYDHHLWSVDCGKRVQLKMAGKSKLRQESQWIQKKEKEGYCFKLMNN